MKDVLDFIGEHYLTTIILVYLLCGLIGNCINRVFRHWNIRKHGYPPPHCDADGDFRPDSEATGDNKCSD